MLTIHSSSLRATLGDAASQAANGGTPSRVSDDPGGFASLLRQTQATPIALSLHAPAPAPTLAAPPTPPTPPADAAPSMQPTTEPGHPSDDAQASESESRADARPAPVSDATRQSRALLKGKLRAADGAHVAARDARPALDARETRTGDTAAKPVTAQCNAPETQLTSADTANGATGAVAAIDPSVMHWLAGLQRAAGRPAEAVGDRADGQAVAGDGEATGVESRDGTKGGRSADPKLDAASRDKAAAVRAEAADAASAGSFMAAVPAARGGMADRPWVETVGGAGDGAAAGAGAIAPAPTAGTDAASPTTVVIATPVTAPDFAQQLGLRLSVLAKDGVHTAELHLNPADMGPVSVQIVIDGTQARVDFGADIAATRQAIENGLPELASALRDAGFTLAGGGVSQHAGGRHGGGADTSRRDDTRRAMGENEVKRVATAARRIVTRGGVDLIA